MKPNIKKRSQITLLMIIGLVLFILVSLILYLSKASIKKQTQQIIRKTQETPIETQPIREFVSKCVDKLAKDALILIGKQGGYLYRSQGGPLIDYKETDLGKFFLKYDDLKVSYNIQGPKFSVQQYYSLTPEYPWLSFPFKDKDSADEIYNGFFGINNMPPLNDSEGPNSIQTQIENFIDKNMKVCANFDVFKEQDLEISTGPVKTSLIIGNNDISVKTSMPINIYNPTTQEQNEISDFSTNVGVGLRGMYLFVKELIRNDIKDIKYNISDFRNQRDSISVQLIENVYYKDDLVIVTDEKSIIYGKPYKYIFSRKNRAPALYYIKENVLSFPDEYVITQNELLKNAELKSYDPDEDELSFTVEALAGDPSLPKVLNVPQLKFKVEVNDGKLSDHQIIIVNRI